jgi:hypothetical protein
VFSIITDKGATNEHVPLQPEGSFDGNNVEFDIPQSPVDSCDETGSEYLEGGG